MTLGLQANAHWPREESSLLAFFLCEYPVTQNCRLDSFPFFCASCSFPLAPFLASPLCLPLSLLPLFASLPSFPFAFPSLPASALRLLVLLLGSRSPSVSSFLLYPVTYRLNGLRRSSAARSSSSPGCVPHSGLLLPCCCCCCCERVRRALSSANSCLASRNEHSDNGDWPSSLGASMSAPASSNTCACVGMHKVGSVEAETLCEMCHLWGMSPTANSA